MGRKMEKLQRVFMPTSSRAHKRDDHNESAQRVDPSTTGSKSSGPGNRIIGTSNGNTNAQSDLSSKLTPAGAEGTPNNTGSYAPSTASMISGHIGRPQGRSPLSDPPATNTNSADSAIAGTSGANATSRGHEPQRQVQQDTAASDQDVMQSGPPVRDLPGSAMAAVAPGPTEPVGYETPANREHDNTSGPAGHDNLAKPPGTDSHLPRDGATIAGAGAVAAGGAAMAADKQDDTAGARDLSAHRQGLVDTSAARPNRGVESTSKGNRHVRESSEGCNPYSTKALDPRVEGALGDNHAKQPGGGIGRKPVPHAVSAENQATAPVDSRDMTEGTQGHSTHIANALATGGVGAGALGAATAAHGHEDRDAGTFDATTGEQTATGYQPSSEQQSSARQQMPTTQDSSTGQTSTEQPQSTDRPRYMDRNPTMLDQEIPGAFPLETPQEDPGTATTTNEVTGSSARPIPEPDSTVQDIPESGPRVMGIPPPQSAGIPEPLHTVGDSTNPVTTIRNVAGPESIGKDGLQQGVAAGTVPKPESAVPSGPKSTARDIPGPEAGHQHIMTPLLPLTAGAAQSGAGGQSDLVSPFSSNWPALGNEASQKGVNADNPPEHNGNSPEHDGRAAAVGLGAAGLGAVGLGGAAVAHNSGKQDESIPSQGPTSEKVVRKPSKLEKESKRHSRNVSTEEGKEKKGLFHRLTHRRESKRGSYVGLEDNAQAKASREPESTTSRGPVAAAAPAPAVPVAAVTTRDGATATEEPPSPNTPLQDTAAAPVAIPDRTSSRGHDQALPETASTGQHAQQRDEDKMLQEKKDEDHHYGTAAGAGAAGVGAVYLTSRALRSEKNAEDSSVGDTYGAATAGALGVPAALDPSRKDISPGATSSVYSQQPYGQQLPLGSEVQTGGLESGSGAVAEYGQEGVQLSNIPAEASRTGPGTVAGQSQQPPQQFQASEAETRNIGPGYERSGGYTEQDAPVSNVYRGDTQPVYGQAVPYGQYGPQAMENQAEGTGAGYGQQGASVASPSAYPPESEPAIRRADPRFIAAGFTDPDFPSTQADQSAQYADGYAQGAPIDSRTAPHLTQQQIQELEFGQQSIQYQPQQQAGYYGQHDPGYYGQQQAGYDAQDQSNVRYAAAGAAGSGSVGTGAAMGYAGNYTPPKSPNDGSFPRDVGYNPAGSYGQMRAPDSPAGQELGRGPGGRGWTPGVDDPSRENSWSGGSGIEHKGPVTMQRGEKGRMRLHKEPKKGHHMET